MNKKVGTEQSVLTNRLQLDPLLSLAKLLNLTNLQTVKILRIISTNYTLHGIRSLHNEDRICRVHSPTNALLLIYITN